MGLGFRLAAEVQKYPQPQAFHLKSPATSVNFHTKKRFVEPGIQHLRVQGVLEYVTSFPAACHWILSKLRLTWAARASKQMDEVTAT